MDDSRIHNTTFFLFNNTVLICMSLGQTHKDFRQSEHILTLQQKVGQQHIPILLPNIYLNIGQNIIQYQLPADNIYFYSLIQLNLISQESKLRLFLQSADIFYDDQENLLQIKALTIYPTNYFSLKIRFYGLGSYILQQVNFGTISFNNINCPGLQQATSSLIQVYCNLEEIGFEIQQYLAFLVKDNYIPIKIHTFYQNNIIETSLIEQLVNDNDGNCLSDPNFVLTCHGIQIIFQTLLTDLCTIQVQQAFIQLNFSSSRDFFQINQSFTSFPQFTKGNKISFSFVLKRKDYQSIILLYDQYSVSALAIYYFEYTQQKFYSVIPLNKIEYQNLDLSLRFSKTRISLFYNNAVLQQSDLEIFFFLQFGIQDDMYINTTNTVKQMGQIVLTDQNIRQHFNPDTYVANPTIIIIYDKIIKAKELFVIVESTTEIHVISTFINTEQYLNFTTYMIFSFVFLVQLTASLLFFSLTKKYQ